MAPTGDLSPLRTQPTNELLQMKLDRALKDSEPNNVVSQELLRKQPGAEMRYLLSKVRGTLVERLHQHMICSCPDSERRFSPLSAFVSIRRGEELGKDSSLLLTQRPDNGQAVYPLLRGGVDVRPYTISTATYWIARQHIVKSLERYLAPKLLVVKSTGNLQAALDHQGHVVLRTLYLLQPHIGIGCNGNSKIIHNSDSLEDELYFLLALLNSHLLNEYIQVISTAYKWVQPQLEQHVLARLPVPLVESEEKVPIINQAKILARACSPASSVVELDYEQDLSGQSVEDVRAEQERAIYRLYEAVLNQSYQ